MAITGFDEGIITPEGLAFIAKVEDQVRTSPRARTPHLFPEGMDDTEREAIVNRFELINHYAVTRTPTGLIVVVPGEDD